MSAATSNFIRLTELAKASSSDQRRELLREVTDLFFVSSGARSERETALFDDVLRTVAAEMQEGVLIELARRFADADDAPVQLMRDLANHALPVSEPILRKSKVLTDEVLMEVVRDQSQDHLRAVAQRDKLSERLSDAIVKHGDDTTVDKLVRNTGAQISRTTMETVVDRARTSKILHAGVVGRPDMPLDLLNEMYFVVEQRLRETIMTRNATVDPRELDAALETTRSRLQRVAVESTEETRRAERYVALKKASGELTPSLLISLYRDKQYSHFLFGLADLTGIDFETARGIIHRRDLDALAMICRAAGMERPLFVTIAVLCCGGERAMNQAEEFGRAYTSVPIEAAQRAMRFFKVRKSAEDKEAA